MPRKLATLACVVAAALLAGCSGTSGSRSEAEAAPASSGGRCDAAQAQFAVGQQASAGLLSDVRNKSGSQEARILGPHDMVTLEYRSERVNVNTDAAGKVVRVSCG